MGHISTFFFKFFVTMILTTSVKTNATNAISLIIILIQQLINNRFIVSNPSFHPRHLLFGIFIFIIKRLKSLPHLLRQSTSEA